MAIWAIGTLLKVGDGGATEAFTTVYQVNDISGPTLNADLEDVSNHSTTGGWSESIPTLLHGGDISFDVNYEPDQATLDASTGLINDFQDRTLRNFQLIFPDTGNTTWTFAAYVTGFEVSAPVAGKLSASVTLTISGQPTLA